VSWLRYSDDFTTDRSWDGVSYEARWQYFAMVEECSQARRWDGALPVTRAVRCSDTPDPDKCIEELEHAGRVLRRGDVVLILDIEDRIPPEGQRDENLLPRKRSNVNAYRKRRCEAGDHSKDCPRATCPLKNGVTTHVTGNAGTGRDGTTTVTAGKNNSRSNISTDKEEHQKQFSDDDGWSDVTVAVPGSGFPEWAARAYAAER